MKKIGLTGILLAGCIWVQASGKPAYRLFTAHGVEVEYSLMLQEMTGADLVFFGELHNNPIAHWLEIEMVTDLYREVANRLMLAAEMFEADNQLLLDEYLHGWISTGRFEEEAKLWKNYSTDYKPLVEFAREHQLRFIASNVPRRYASMVAAGGFEALENISSEARDWIAPLPVPYDPQVGSYRKMLEMDHGGGMTSVHLPKAQALKDATMAHFILDAWEPGQLVFHVNGSYHSENHEGILWYLEHYRPGLTIVTVATVLQENMDELDEEHRGKADYLIVVPANMTTTY